MVDGKRFVEVTETMKENLDDVSKSLREIQKYNEGLAKSFVGLTKTSTPFGRAWLALGRFTSGTGFWKFQNKVKALSDILQYQELLLKKRLEQEDELMAKLSNYDKHVEVLKKTEESIIKLQQGKLDYVNTEATFKSKYYKILQAEHGTTKAIAILKERAVTAQKKASVFEKEMDGPRIKSFKREGLKLRQLQKEFELYEKMESKGKASTKDLERKNKIQSQISKMAKNQFMTEEDLEKLNDKQLTLMLKLKDAADERSLLQKSRLTELKVLNANVASAKTKEEKSEAEKTRTERKKEMDAELRERKKLIKEYQDDLQKEDIDVSVDNRGGKANIKVDTSNMKEKTLKDKTLDYLKLSKAYKMWEKRHLIKEWGIKRMAIVKERGFRKLMGKGMKGVFKATGKFLFFALQATLVLTLLVILLVGLYKMKILDKIMMFLVGAFFFMGKVIELATPVIEALFIFLSDIFSFISALFSGDGELVQEAGMKLLKSAGSLIMTVLEFIWNIAFEALDGLTGGWFTKAKEKFEELFGEGKASAIALGALVVGTLFVLYGMWLTASYLIAAATSSPIVMLIALAITLIAGILGLFGGHADGGMAKGGPALVGERGPEIVSLPKGSRVHTNAQSRKMVSGTTNNITVNVQGRVGASDAELRDIANKISKMISTQINRTTTSGTRI